MTPTETVSRAAVIPDGIAALRRQYSCDPVELAGSADVLYDRHLLFDKMVDPAHAEARER